MGSKYSMEPKDSEVAAKLVECAAQRVAVSFIAVDLAKTAEGEWIIIEANDAQESGFVDLNSLSLWHNTIEAMQNRNWISVEDMFDEDTVIMGSNPTPDVTIEEMNLFAKQAETEKELADDWTWNLSETYF